MQALRGSATFAVSGAACQTRSYAAAQPLLAAAPQHRTRAAAAASGTAALAARTSVACRLPAATPLRAARRRVLVCGARRGGGDDDSPTVSERLVSAIPYLLPLLDGLRYSACPRARAANPVALQPVACLSPALTHDSRPCLRASPGRFFFLEFPQAAVAILPLRPLLEVSAAARGNHATRWNVRERCAWCSHAALPPPQLYTSVPFGSLIAFFALYLGIVKNQEYSSYVRFNGQARACEAQGQRPPLTLALSHTHPQQAILLDIVLILPSLFEQLFRMPSSGFGLNLYIALCAFAPRRRLPMNGT